MDTEATLLLNLTMMLIVAGICSILLKKIKMPAIVGYLIAGILLGPYVFTQFVVDQNIVTIFSDMGIVLLMFFIGLELNLKGLKKVMSFSLIIVTVEMTIMVVTGYLFGVLLGFSSPQALFLGVTIACASTAVILSLIHDNKQMEPNLIKTVTGILVMEDIGIVVIMSMVDPIIGGSSSGSLFDTMILIIIFIVLSIYLGLAFVPRFLDWVERRHSSEALFLIGIGLAFGLAFISKGLGLSTSIGAFIAGIITSQAKSSQEMMHKVEPMKEVFMAIFFISIGIQLDPDLILEALPIACIIALVFIVGKIVSVSIGCLAANFKIRSSLYVATSMVAMGEFTFIVAKTALDGGVITNSFYTSVITAALITMMLYPVISRSAPKIIEVLSKYAPRRLHKDVARLEVERDEIRRRLGASTGVKKAIRKQILYIFVDYIIIFTILFMVDVVSVVKNLIMGYSNQLDIIPSIILYIVTIFLLLPPVRNIINRLRAISGLLAATINGDNIENRERQATVYKLFMNMGSAISVMLIFILVVPMMPPISGIVMFPIEITACALITAWLIWDTLRGKYNKAPDLVGNKTDKGAKTNK